MNDVKRKNNRSRHALTHSIHFLSFVFGQFPKMTTDFPSSGAGNGNLEAMKTASMSHTQSKVHTGVQAQILKL